MKKIVPKLLVISSQILIGALFLIFIVSSKNETSFKVNSKKIEKLSQFVYNENTDEKISLEEVKNDKEIEKVNNEVEGKVEETVIDEEVKK